MDQSALIGLLGVLAGGLAVGLPSLMWMSRLNSDAEKWHKLAMHWLKFAQAAEPFVREEGLSIYRKYIDTEPKP